MISAPYDWLSGNRTQGYATWDDEVTHVESLGYALVPPDYHIPHWSQAEGAPKLYVHGRDGALYVLRGVLGHPASHLGYPVYFKKDAGLPAPAEDLKKVIRELAVALEFARSVCEHSEGRTLVDRDRLRTGMCASIDTLRRHKDHIAGYQDVQWWQEVCELGEKTEARR